MSTSNNETPDARFIEAQDELMDLKEQVDTVILGTVSAHGEPSSSYAPYVLDSSGNFYLYISALAKHTSNLKRTRKCSTMLVEDEQCADSLFARKRSTWDCSVEVVPRGSDEFEERMKAFADKFGDIIESLSSMTDFTLFRLIPAGGTLVLGFGRAFRIQAWEVQTQAVNASKGGHQTR